MADDNKPEGYYDEIDYPFERKDEVVAPFTDYTIIEHTSAKKEYGHLEDNDVVLEIVNPHRDENLFIKLAEKFTLFFSSWHSHYFLYEYDFSEMKKDALAITNGEYGVLCFIIKDKWYGCNLLTEEISHLTDPMVLVKKMKFPEEHIQKIKNNGVAIYADYWKPNDCYEFEVEKDSMTESSFTFPRRYEVRFVLKDGNCYGSGSQKKYDDEASIITYTCIENVDNPDEIKKTVIQKLEQDAKKAGATRIFENIETADFDLYVSLGYSEVAKIDNDRVHELCGAIVEFDKTMMKIL